MAVMEEVQLDFEKQMCVELLAEDGLVVLARGLGLDRLFLKFLKLYSDPHSLVLVLNTSPAHESYYQEELLREQVEHLPRSITNEVSAKEREQLYLRGGVVFVTSRILVVDLLRRQCPVEMVAGVLVWNAHKVTDSTTEAFILRLYREATKTGFIKAFSDSPEQFTSGFCQLERVMRNLFLRNVYLWPRFHATVSASLARSKPDVVELRQQLSPCMTVIQMAVLDIMKTCVSELKAANPALDMEEVTVETCMSKSFDQVVRLQLDPVWNQLGSKTKQLVFDLRTLRTLLYYLTQYDCVTFYHYLESLRSGGGSTFSSHSNWVFLEAANQLFGKARERVFGSQMKEASQTSKVQDLLLEESPKWHLLSMVLNEVRQETKSRQTAGHTAEGEGGGGGRVLVVVNDERTCYQLRQYLCNGGRALLEQQFKKFLSSKYPQYKLGGVTRGVARGGARKRKRPDPKRIVPKQKVKEEEEAGGSSSQEEGELEAAVLEELAQAELQFNEEGGLRSAVPTQDHTHFNLLSEPIIILYALTGSDNPHNLTKVLNDQRPRYLIMYDPDIRSVRQLEVYKATRPSSPLRVYFLLYDSSVEEQKYLTALRREKEAFQQLIKERAHMVVPVDREGKVVDSTLLRRDSAHSAALDHTHSRKAGGQTTVEKVIVDMREFRSSLPSLLHKRGLDIIPLTLEVGDYVLTPDVCVERKSVSDLIGSLNSGRLYNQATAMTRHYHRPILLIEFEENRPFSLQSLSSLQSDISSQSTLSKLVLLTLHFPSLRILWCPSPYATAELFQELKAGHAQPDPEQAVSIGQDTLAKQQGSEYSGAPQDFLLKLPGINSKNYRYILEGVRDLQELVSLSEVQLEGLLGNSSNASLLFSFFHSPAQPAQRALNSK